MTDIYNKDKEINEAIRAGERALESLREANRQLDSAGNWGILDILGGNTVSGIMKHMKVNNASRCIEDARRDMAAFRDELDDIRDISGLNIDIGGFLTFADFFFDGFIRPIQNPQGPTAGAGSYPQGGRDPG
jgi:predicted transcriptional regulator